MRWNGEIVRILQNNNLEIVNAFIQNCKKGINYPHLLESQFLRLTASTEEPDQEWINKINLKIGMKKKIKIGMILVKTRIQNYEDQITLTVVTEVLLFG